MPKCRFQAHKPRCSAGNVGAKLTDLAVITTASRGETTAWPKDLGANHGIDHTKPLAAQVDALGIGAPAFVYSTTHTDQHLADIAKLIARKAGSH